MESRDLHYVDYIRAVMKEVKQRFGIPMFEERYEDAHMAEARMRRLYETRIPPRLAAEALVTGSQPQPQNVHFTPGTDEWSALLSVCELARARVAHIQEELFVAGATEGRVTDIIDELASHVQTLDRIVSRFNGFMPTKEAM